MVGEESDERSETVCSLAEQWRSVLDSTQSPKVSGVPSCCKQEGWRDKGGREVRYTTLGLALVA